jgi:class 3 adenylate cyclase
VCEIEFGTGREHAIEITFNIHPSIREVPRVYYCSAEPATKLHIKLTQRLEPGERRRVATRLGPGRYRLRLEGEQRYRYLDVRPGAAAELAWAAEDGAAADTLVAAPAPALELAAGARSDVFVVEDTQWSDDALRPAQLFNLQTFRDLFSEEYLAADFQLEVGEQTILFTDIVGSTRLYGERGDPHAFMEVRRHFVELYEEVARHRGAVIKTIGDAGMAAFANPVDGLLAAAAILRRFPAGREDTEVRLRASLNTGPCIAVNLNSGIDYFGSTVNLASKLQACASAGEIAVSRAALRLPGVEDALSAEGAQLRAGRLEHTAFAEPVEVVVWSVGASSTRARRPGVAR